MANPGPQPDPMHAPESEPEGAARLEISRWRGVRSRRDADCVAIEEPLEIQLGGSSLAVVMRTPGHDAELVRGFLVTERVVEHAEQIASLRHCSLARSPEAVDNVVRVRLAEGVELDLERLRRNLFASSSCGVCGKATIENALATAPPIDDERRVDAAWLAGLPGALRTHQSVFERTGGLHAAALFDGSGALRVVREDVGRHNAVDKVVGWALGAGSLPLSGHVLLVSGRASFEIVQKALAARIPLVVAVSAPSSLAISLAQAAGIGLVGFLRGSDFNVYAHAARVVGAPT